MVGANGTMAEKMQNALATLEEDISDIPEGHENGQRSAAGMALRMGVFAEEEVRCLVFMSIPHVSLRSPFHKP